MSKENLATLRDPINPEARSSQLEAREGEISTEAAEHEIQTEFQREKSQVEGLGKASDDPEAEAVTQATIVELEGVHQKYSRQLDSVIDPGAHAATIREPAKVYDFQEEKTLREKRATLRASFKNKQEEDEERNKAIEGVLDEKGLTEAQRLAEEKNAQEGLRAERLRKRTEHAVPVTIREEAPPTIVSDLPPTLPSAGAEENALPIEPVRIETSPMAQSVRLPEVLNANKETLRSAGNEESLEVDLTDLESGVAPEEVQSEKVLRATQEGLEELSGDEWSDLYQQSGFAWTPEIWGNLNNQAPTGEASEREQLRQLGMNKAEMALKLMANAIAIRELGKLALSVEAVEEGGVMGMQEQMQSLQEHVPSERQQNLLLEQRKLEQGLAQDKAKERELFEVARERAEAIEVDISELAETPVDALVAKINKPPSGYTDEELERIANESAANKTAVSPLERAGGGIMYGTAAVGLAVLAKVTWSLFSGKAASKVLDWIDKGMEKIQKYAFKNDFSSIFDIAKNTGDAIHKKMDESIAKGEKKESP